MKVCGIVAEFNPFHNGHAHLISEVKRSGADGTVIVMSGNYVQRGEPAIVETGTRARAALNAGADLILQLPVARVLSGASGFAHGAVEIFEACGIIDEIAFGSECADAEKLKRIVQKLKRNETDESVKKYLESGITYAAAREQAVRDSDSQLADIMREPNDILGIEYIAALDDFSSGIVPVAYGRTGAGHDSDLVSGNIAGAREIRKMIYNGTDFSYFVPDVYSPDDFSDLISPDKLEAAVLCRLRTMSREEILLAPDISEGLENRIYTAVAESTGLSELYDRIKTKRYTYSRIRRIVMNLFLGITKEESVSPIPYIRVLGMNEKGKEMLRDMKQRASLPVISKTSDVYECGNKVQNTFETECKTTDIYNALLFRSQPCGKEKSFNPVII